ncbi:MAG: VOC family protein [Chloroflexi bacterium]|nr:VOC family protein [Chloroflexota bacterium]
MERWPLFTKVAHVGVIVSDLDRTIEQLSALGMGPFQPLVVGPPNDKRIRISQTKIGDTGLELLQPLEEDTLWKKFLQTKGEGIHHLGFMVEDLDGALTEMTRQGAEVLMTSKRPTGGGIAYLAPRGSGIIIEIIQR